MTKKGFDSGEALRLLLKQQEERPGPYTLIGCSEISKPFKLKTRPKPMDAPLYSSVFEAYTEFRKIFPVGRYAMVLASKFNPETWDPREAILVDTQLVEKAVRSPDYKDKE